MSSKRKKTINPQIKFQNKESSSLNSSCNDSVISCSDSAISRCTSSCGERSSLSELELSCSSTDNEDVHKCVNDNETSKSNQAISTQQKQPEQPKSDDKVDGKLQIVEKQQSFKVESNRKSILLANQVTKNKITSISITAPKLLLPKEVLETIGLNKSNEKEDKLNIRFHTFSLNKDVEYKTLSISKETTSKQVISMLLNKFKLKHRDSNLYFITMEIIIRKSGIPFRSVIVLNDEASPAQLKACYPNDELKFSIQSKPGGLIRVYDSCLIKGSLYKSIIIAENTTVSELIQLMLNCYNSKDKASNYSLFVVNKVGSYKLEDSELPLYVQDDWDSSLDPIFQLRKISDDKCKKQMQIKRWSAASNFSLMLFQNHFYI